MSNKDMYFVISSNEDGDADCYVFDSKVELVEFYELNNEEVVSRPEFFSEAPEEHDIQQWGESMLIIKGHVITPKPVKTVVEYELE